MIRIIWPGPLPNDTLQRFFHPSIDQLIDIIHGEGSKNGASLERRAKKFSEILRHLRIGNCWKCTKRYRLEETNRILAASLQHINKKEINFLDVGASDGITTYDSLKYLSLNLDIKVNVYLADRYLYIHRLKRGPVVEYITNDGQPILVRIGPIALLLGPTDGLSGFLVNPEIILSKNIVLAYLKTINIRSKMRLTEIIPLINPMVFKKSKFKFIEMDILEFNKTMKDSMDVIRASNIITKAYFSQEQIKKAIAILHSYLHEGGFLLISRNLDEHQGAVENGSIWRKSGHHFEHIADLSIHSEIKELVDQFNRPL